MFSWCPFYLWIGMVFSARMSKICLAAKKEFLSRFWQLQPWLGLWCSRSPISNCSTKWSALTKPLAFTTIPKGWQNPNLKARPTVFIVLIIKFLLPINDLKSSVLVKKDDGMERSSDAVIAQSQDTEVSIDSYLHLILPSTLPAWFGAQLSSNSVIPMLRSGDDDRQILRQELSIKLVSDSIWVYIS